MRISWKKADGSSGERISASNKQDAQNLGYVDWPVTEEQWLRHDIFLGLLMEYPTEDVAAYVVRNRQVDSAMLDRVMQDITTICQAFGTIRKREIMEAWTEPGWFEEVN